MIAPRATPQIAVARPPPPEFFFLGTQGPQSGYLLPSLRGTTKSAALPALDSFVESVFHASDRVWILDPYFDHQHGLPALFRENAVIESNANFRIISREAMPGDWLRAHVNWNVLSRRIEWRQRSYRWLHGRFALVDNELWHFGSTVGGCYPGFDAASRWHDPTLVTAFQHQFEDIWGERIS